MIIPLRPDDINRVWLVPETHFTTRLLRQHMEKHPHLGYMVRESGDYIIGGYWKERPTIGLVMESSPSSQRAVLVDRLLDSYRSNGGELVVLSEREVSHGLRLYSEMGFVSLEEVICYERPDAHVPVVARRLSMRPLHEAQLPALVKLETETFPWLWWETVESFRSSMLRADTWTLLGYLGDELAGYLILAVRGAWGHLNRIGVHPSRQGQGFGAELLAIAIEEMAHRGARTIGLNTQNYNERSRRLYESFGFVRTGETFHIYGKWLNGSRG